MHSNQSLLHIIDKSLITGVVDVVINHINESHVGRETLIGCVGWVLLETKEETTVEVGIGVEGGEVGEEASAETCLGALEGQGKRMLQLRAEKELL